MYDVIIVGAGVIGSSIARELSKYDLDIVVIEKGIEVCQGTTKANSAIIHGGYDAKEGTLKAKLNVLGNTMYKKLCKDLGVEYNQCGSLVLAFDDKEVKHINELYERGIKNNVRGLKILTKEEILRIEPNINKNVISALHCDVAAVVCPFNLNIALMENAISNNVKLNLESEVIDINKIDEIFKVKINHRGKEGIIHGKYIINCAGVYSDKINNMIGGKEYFITPRKGEYKVLDKSEGKLVNNVLFQCPTSKGKGILITKTVHGNLLVGPNANYVNDKEDISTTKEGLKEIVEKSKKSIDNIDFKKTITSFSGLRATSNTNDFMIFASDICKNFINVGGIESPGLASAPAIAEYVVNILEREGLDLIKDKSFNPIRNYVKPFNYMSNEEKQEAIKDDANYKRIICRCESITEAEIIKAINSPCGAKTVDGVKRRVRPGMGICQGGFCAPKVIEIISRELDIRIEDVVKDYEKSNLVISKVKNFGGDLS